MNQIARHYSPSVAITANSTAGTTSERIAYAPFSGGAVLIANTGGCTQIQWHGCDSQNGVPLQIYADGSAVATSVVVGAHPIPDACFGMHFVVPVVVGAATCAMTVMVKG